MVDEILQPSKIQDQMFDSFHMALLYTSEEMQESLDQQTTYQLQIT